MPKLSMSDMASAPPSTGAEIHLALQQAKQERLMLKEKRLAKTEDRLMSQHELARQRQEYNLQAKKEQAEENVRIEAGIALDTAADICDYRLSETERRFLVEYAVQLHRAKVI